MLCRKGNSILFLSRSRPRIWSPPRQVRHCTKIQLTAVISPKRATIFCSCLLCFRCTVSSILFESVTGFLTAVYRWAVMLRRSNGHKGHVVTHESFFKIINTWLSSIGQPLSSKLLRGGETATVQRLGRMSPCSRKTFFPSK